MRGVVVRTFNVSVAKYPLHDVIKSFLLQYHILSLHLRVRMQLLIMGGMVSTTTMTPKNLLSTKISGRDEPSRLGNSTSPV